MAAETPATSGGGNDAVANRLSRLNQKMDEAAAAHSRAKNVGRVMTLLIVVGAVAGVWVFLITPFRDAYENQKVYQVAFEKELKDRVIPALHAEVEKPEFRQSMKGVGDAVLEKVKSRREEVYAAADTQMRTFVEEMSAWGQEELTSRQKEIETYIETKVKNVAPELAEPGTAEIVLANASGAMESVVHRLIEKHLQKHMVHLISIGDRIEKFPVPPDVAAMSDDELSDALVNELGGYSLSIFRTSLSSDTRQMLRQVGEEESQ